MKTNKYFVNQLKQSLAKTLDVFPLLAGRLAEDGNFVALNNAGVSFRVQYRPGSINAIDKNNFLGEWVDLHPPNDIFAGKSPLMSVVVTIFKGDSDKSEEKGKKKGGVSLGSRKYYDSI